MSASPGGTVNFTIKTGSNTIKNSYPVIAIVIDKTINKIPYATIKLYDGDAAQQNFSISNSNVFVIGSPIEIQAGMHAEEQLLFKGIIVKQAIRSRSHSASFLIISCKDIAYRTTLVPKTTSYSAVKDSDVAKKIIGHYRGLSSDVAATSIQHEGLFQHETTDWDFINIRAEANGQVVIVDDGKLTITKPNIKQSASLSVTYGVDMYAFEAAMDASTQWKSAGGSIWKTDSQKSENVNASEPGEQSFGNVGYSKLASANEQDAMLFYHGGSLAEQEMETFTTGLLAFSRMAKIQGKAKIQGNPAIKPNRVVKINKGAESFQGNAYVSGVRHTIEKGIWSTELTLGFENQRYLRKYTDVVGLPTTGMLPPVHGLQLGVVKKINEDPQAAHRIFVYLPMIHKPNEGVWCRIASFYASQQVGALFIPELEAEVVVGFINDDLRSPVIVGSLYSSNHTPPVAIDEKNTKKTILSATKLELTFNDDSEGPEIILKTPENRIIRISDKERTIEMINGDANKVVLGEQNVEITSSKDIILQAQGSIHLQATQNIALEGKQDVKITGMNISAKAAMKAAIAGDASAELQSSTMTIVKGLMVQIN